MKRKFVVFVAGAAIVCGVAFNFSLNSKNDSLSDLALANVVALAKGEDGGWDKAEYLILSYAGKTTWYENGGEWVCDWFQMDCPGVGNVSCSQGNIISNCYWN